MNRREIHISDSTAAAAAIEVLMSSNPRVMLQMPAVHTLIAPPTQAGIQALNSTKNRLPAKNYGSAIGSLARFHALGDREHLPSEFKTAACLTLLEGAFIRLKVTSPEFNSTAIRGGTHQGLLLPQGPHRLLLDEVEEALRPLAEPELFAGKIYSAPLCTSANLSGDPLGSITDERRAEEFFNSQEIPLWIRCNSATGEAGSYPIFAFDGNQCSIERDGPGRREIQARLPASIRFNRE